MVESSVVSGGRGAEEKRKDNGGIEAVERSLREQKEAFDGGAVVAGSETAEPPRKEPRPSQQEKTLLDRSLYRGRLDGDSQPHGLGVVYPALGTHIYAGEFHKGSKEGVGVQLLPNGTMYAGQLRDEYASGYGVKRDPFGSLFLGEWSEGELHGVGLGVGVDGNVSWGRFHLNELDDSDAVSDVSWRQTQESILKAVLAEQNALLAQERARQVELQVVLQGLTSIESTYFESGEAITNFTAQEDNELKEFLSETQRQYRDVEAEADRWKFQEAQLKERQKNLRREINEKRTELSYLSKYVGIAEERQSQVTDAERTLQALHRQIELLKAQVLQTSSEEQLTERIPVNETPADARDQHFQEPTISERDEVILPGERDVDAVEAEASSLEGDDEVLRPTVSS